MTATHGHEELAISPCESAIATYTIGATSVAFWLAPFADENRYFLPIHQNILDFKWGQGDGLIFATATDDFVVRVWIETSDRREFRCSHWFRCDRPFRFLNFCCPLEDSVSKHGVRQFVSADRNVFPCTPQPDFHLLVGLHDGVSVLLRCGEGPELDRFGTFGLKQEMPFFVWTDCGLKVVPRGVRPVFTTITVSRRAVVFHKIEVPDDRALLSVTFRIPFLERPIRTVVAGSQGKLLTVFEDGTCFNWSDHVPQDYESELVFRELTLQIANDVVSFCARRKPVFSFSLPFVPVFHGANAFVNQALVYLRSERESVMVVFQDNEFLTADVEFVDVNPQKVVFHSTDLFVLCSDDSIFFFFYDGVRYKCVASLTQLINPQFVFIPHPGVVFAVSSINSVTFYEIADGEPRDIATVAIGNVKSMACIGSSFVIATEHALLRLILPESLLPLPIAPNSDYVLLTALSLCKFSALQDASPTPQSFLNRVYAESFSFPVGGNPILREFSQRLPDGWNALDDSGMRFLFCSVLTQIYEELQGLVPFFALWAAISSDQEKLLALLVFPTFQSLCDSYLPIWIKDPAVLARVVLKLVSKPNLLDEEIDPSIVLCIAMNRRHLGAQIARKGQGEGYEKLSTFLRMKGDEKPRSVEKNAFAAQQKHRHSIAAAFFLIRGMNYQAKVVLQTQKMLQILVSRLLGDEDWTGLIEEPFWANWWSGKKDEAMSYMRTHIPQCDLFSLTLHEYNFLKALGRPDRRLLLSVTHIPWFIAEDLNAVVVETPAIAEPPKLANPIGFSFGGNPNDWDDDFESDESDSETDTKPTVHSAIHPVSPQISSNFGTTVISPLFCPFPIAVICPTEDEIVQLLAIIFNHPEDTETLTLLCLSAQSLAHRSQCNTLLLRVVLFAVAYTVCAFGWLSPLVQPECNPSYLQSLADELNPRDPTYGRGRARLAQAVSRDLVASDKELLDYAIFDQLSRRLPIEFRRDCSILPAFLHHRHDIISSRLPSSVFTDHELLSLTETMGLDCKSEVAKMAQSRQRTIWTRAYADPNASLFFASGHFAYTTAARMNFPVKTIRGIAINPHKNQMIAIAGSRVSTGYISQEYLNGTYRGSMIDKQDDEWDVVFKHSTSDSALSSRDDSQSPERVEKRSPVSTLRRRHEFPSRGSVRPRSIDGHPTSELFATGDRSGKLYLWDYMSETATRSIKLSEVPIISTTFSPTGDRILCIDQNGSARVTDFESHVGWQLGSGDVARWLNADNQFAVASPEFGELRIYDLLAGDEPVVSWPIGNGRRTTCLDVWRTKIAIGFNEGTVMLFDARMGVKTASLPLHNQAVTCLRYDRSGCFFVTGSNDNSVNVVEAGESTEIKTFANVIAEYDSTRADRGILSVVSSQQAIIAAGATTRIHAWTVTEIVGGK